MTCLIFSMNDIVCLVFKVSEKMISLYELGGIRSGSKLKSWLKRAKVQFLQRLDFFEFRMDATNKSG